MQKFEQQNTESLPKYLLAQSYTCSVSVMTFCSQNLTVMSDFHDTSGQLEFIYLF